MNRCETSVLLIVFLSCFAKTIAAEPKPQYEAEGISIPAASADEPIRGELSVEAAIEYLEKGASAWVERRKCVDCHTTGVYLKMRPALTSALGKPSERMREFFVEQLKKCEAQGVKKLTSGIGPTKVAYLAQGLAEWDAHVLGKLSEETRDALSLMLKLQSADGSWGNTECWPPFESSSYHGATVAAMALATGPGFLAKMDQQQAAVVAKLTKYLQTQEPPHDYGRLLLLWTASRFADLMTDQQKQQTIEMLWRHQREDGGWSIRSFAAPEGWGNGNRAGKLRSEPEFGDPPSDGHQTGLVVYVLRESGVPASDKRIQRAVRWLKTNQRQSGRWWTRSLNTDTYHFITYSGTFYPLLALQKCDALN
jgi:squalene-hopene/tetraprenyl-beta-curcumene cyclase